MFIELLMLGNLIILSSSECIMNFLHPYRVMALYETLTRPAGGGNDYVPECHRFVQQMRRHN